ncbi:MAG: dihydroorotate dehydrogenase electron transfer subunit [Candidatus Omnitrophota bacterium]
MHSMLAGSRKAMMPKKYDEWVAVHENRKINSKYYKLTFRSKLLARGAMPGQFLHLQVHADGTFALRRPFSYYRVSGDQIEVLYEVLGKGTAVLAKKQKGDRLKVMGPLGRPFTAKAPGLPRLLVAGGIGIPPLVFFAEKNKVDYLLIGIKSKTEKMPPQELARVKAKILYASDDGSLGFHGYVTGLLEKVLRDEDISQAYIQTCGPKVMMKTVFDIVRKRKLVGEASIDTAMACGVGACLGCMVKTREGWVASCTEGPVFDFEQLNEESFQ